MVLRRLTSGSVGRNEGIGHVCLSRLDEIRCFRNEHDLFVVNRFEVECRTYYVRENKYSSKVCKKVCVSSGRSCS